MASCPGVLFDVDGTLVDTNYLHTLAWARAFRDVGEWAPMNAIHRLVGMGGDQLVPRVLGHENEEASRRRSVRYGELIREAVAFPMAGDLLRAVRDRGLAVVLATSSPDEELAVARELIGAEEAIDAVTKKDDVEHTKPAPDLFEAALLAGDVDRARALVVGDSVWDVQAAKAAGLGCIGVETGGFSGHELRRAGAVAVYADVAELLAGLATSPLAALDGQHGERVATG